MESPPKKGRLKRAMMKKKRLISDLVARALAPGRGALALMSSLSLAAFLTSLLPLSSAADLVIRFPGDLSQQDGFYRLYYTPEVGSPQVSGANFSAPPNSSLNCFFCRQIRHSGRRQFQT